MTVVNGKLVDGGQRDAGQFAPGRNDRFIGRTAEPNVGFFACLQSKIGQHFPGSVNHSATSRLVSDEYASKEAGNNGKKMEHDMAQIDGIFIEQTLSGAFAGTKLLGNAGDAALSLSDMGFFGREGHAFAQAQAGPGTNKAGPCVSHAGTFCSDLSRYNGPAGHMHRFTT